MVRLLPAIAVFLVLSGCADYKVETGQSPMNESIEPDPVIAKIITPYQTSLDSLMDSQIGELAVDMVAARTELETRLGNFVADLTYEYALHNGTEGTHQPDMCILNFGGLRTSLSKGPISLRDVYELMPFENKVVVLELSYEQMKGLFQYLAVQAQPVANASLVVKEGGVDQASVGGEPLSERKYRVVTSDYLAKGGDKMKFFDGAEWVTEHIKLRDVIAQHFEKSSGALSAEIEGRIKRGE